MWFGACALASGASLAVRPERRRRAWQSRIDALRAGAPERYFEELRALEAYPVPPSDRRLRLYGVALLLCGAVLTGLGLMR